MDKALYLMSSVLLSSGRNVISKKTATLFGGKGDFFLSQTLLFGAASVLLLPFSVKELLSANLITLIFGVIYGLLLISSQWMFTLALKFGETSVCTVIYSLGFIIPTVTGTVFYSETLSLPNYFGIAPAAAVVLLSAKGKEKGRASKLTFLPFILVAMVSSGGLGIMQKLQQNSSAANTPTAFLFTAFFLAFAVSLIAFLLCREKPAASLKASVFPIAAGLSFGGANFFNTVLAGKMKSGVFFPLQNVSTILLSSLLGILLLKEKPTLKTALVLTLGAVVIILFSI